jgi:hypothetical protein
LVFTGLWFGIYLGLPSGNYVIEEERIWRPRRFASYFRLYFVIVKDSSLYHVLFVAINICGIDFFKKTSAHKIKVIHSSKKIKEILLFSICIFLVLSPHLLRDMMTHTKNIRAAKFVQLTDVLHYYLIYKHVPHYHLIGIITHELTGLFHSFTRIIAKWKFLCNSYENRLP